MKAELRGWFSQMCPTLPLLKLVLKLSGKNFWLNSDHGDFFLDSAELGFDHRYSPLGQDPKLNVSPVSIIMESPNNWNEKYIGYVSGGDKLLDPDPARC